MHEYRHDPLFSEVNGKLLSDLTYFKSSPRGITILCMKNTLDKNDLSQCL